MPNEVLEEFDQGKQSRLVVSKGYQIDPKHGLHLGMLVKVVENYLRVLTLLELDHNPHAGFIGLIT